LAPSAASPTPGIATCSSAQADGETSDLDVLLMLAPEDILARGDVLQLTILALRHWLRAAQEQGFHCWARAAFKAIVVASIARPMTRKAMRHLLLMALSRVFFCWALSASRQSCAESDEHVAARSAERRAADAMREALARWRRYCTARFQRMAARSAPRPAEIVVKAQHFDELVVELVQTKEKVSKQERAHQHELRRRTGILHQQHHVAMSDLNEAHVEELRRWRDLAVLHSITPPRSPAKVVSPSGVRSAEAPGEASSLSSAVENGLHRPRAASVGAGAACADAKARIPWGRLRAELQPERRLQSELRASLLSRGGSHTAEGASPSSAVEEACSRRLFDDDSPSSAVGELHEADADAHDHGSTLSTGVTKVVT
jgi:hypothetical protein